MAKTFIIILLTMLTLYAGICTAEDTGPGPQLLDSLMDRSGLDRQLEQMSPLIKDVIIRQNDRNKTVSVEDMDELGHFVSMACDAAAMKESVRKHMQINLSETDIKAALAWLRSSLGAKVSRLERASATPAAQTEKQKMGNKLIENAGRLARARKLDHAVKATETAVSMALNTRSVELAAQAIGTPHKSYPTMESIRQEALKNKGQIQADLEKETLLSLLYTYRNLSDAEFDRYLDFAASDSGKKYFFNMSEALSDAMTNSSNYLVSLIVIKAGNKASGAAKP